MLTLADPMIRQMPLVESENPFVNLETFGEGIAVDKSRTLIENHSDYFLWVRLEVATRLNVANRLLSAPFRLLVIEGYRPLAVQRAYFRQHMATLRRQYPNADEHTLIDLTSRWIAPPDVGAHPTGAAVDITLQHADGSRVDMGSVVNATNEASSGACYTRSAFISRRAARHRQILFDAMTSAGFLNYPSEWWHWSYGDRYWAVCEKQPHALFGPVEEDALSNMTCPPPRLPRLSDTG